MYLSVLANLKRRRDEFQVFGQSKVISSMIFLQVQSLCTSLQKSTAQNWKGDD